VSGEVLVVAPEPVAESVLPQPAATIADEIAKKQVVMEARMDDCPFTSACSEVRA
jgi:hypothetical protein